MKLSLYYTALALSALAGHVDAIKLAASAFDQELLSQVDKTNIDSSRQGLCTACPNMFPKPPAPRGPLTVAERQCIESERKLKAAAIVDHLRAGVRLLNEAKVKSRDKTKDMATSIT